jgi:hypothetical protein
MQGAAVQPRGEKDDNLDDIFDVEDDDEDEMKEQGGAGLGVAEIPGNDDREVVIQAEQFRKTTTGRNDMYDDSQGYYNFMVGEVMAGRYVFWLCIGGIMKSDSGVRCYHTKEYPRARC